MAHFQVKLWRVEHVEMVFFGMISKGVSGWCGEAGWYIQPVGQSGRYLAWSNFQWKLEKVWMTDSCVIQWVYPIKVVKKKCSKMCNSLQTYPFKTLSQVNKIQNHFKPLCQVTKICKIYLYLCAQEQYNVSLHSFFWKIMFLWGQARSGQCTRMPFCQWRRHFIEMWEWLARHYQSNFTTETFKRLIVGSLGCCQRPNLQAQI